MKDGLQILIVTAVSLAWWLAVGAVTGRAEAWDAPDYMTLIYPLSLGLAALFGSLFPRQAWRWGAIVLFAQFPVMVVQSGMGPLFAVGLAMLLGLSIPAMFAAEGAAWLRQRFSRAAA
jgi:hypothetical protein